MLTKLISYNCIRTTQFPSQKGKKKMLLYFNIRVFFYSTKNKADLNGYVITAEVKYKSVRYCLEE